MKLCRLRPTLRCRLAKANGSESRPYLFLREHATRGHRTLVKRDLKHAAPRDVLPERARLLQAVDGDGNLDLVAELDEAVVLLRSWTASADVWVSCDDESVARALVRAKFGRVLQAIRDGESRVMFCGYSPLGYKLAIWTLSAMVCGVAGAL